MSDWVEWNGGECPLPMDAAVQVRYLGGGTNKTVPAGLYRWTHEHNDGDIIAYRELDDPASSKQDHYTAEHYLTRAADEMRDRAASRDTESERSMARAVRAFWTIYGDAILERGHMTETEGWQFMSILKKVRGAQGEYREDDYTDDVAYAALAAESASK